MLGVILWVHLLSMIGCFGGLLAFQIAIPKAIRSDAAVGRRASLIFNILIAIGLLAGLAGFVSSRGWELGSHYSRIIGIKFVLLLGIGALLGMGRKSGRGDLFRTISIVLFAIAAYCGITLIR